MMRPSQSAIDRIVSLALEEDAPWGDITSASLIPEKSQISAKLVAREAGILSGEDVFLATMKQADPTIRVSFETHDGHHFDRDELLATIQGPARGVLLGERVALNFAQRLSGIATMTAAYVAETAGTKARIVDTRKTTPGLRLLERYAVRCGGGHNHRYSLSDAVLAKDNHLAVLTGGDDEKLTQALLDARSRMDHTTHFEVEIDRPEQIELVLAAGVDTIMFDNFTTAQMRAGVVQVAGRALVEASGGILLSQIREIAETGVDIISVGALTHSVRSLDLGLDIASL